MESKRQLVIMITHDGDTKKLQWPPASTHQGTPDLQLLKRMVLEKFDLKALKPEELGFRVASYSASLISDEVLDDRLLERVL